MFENWLGYIHEILHRRLENHIMQSIAAQALRFSYRFSDRPPKFLQDSFRGFPPTHDFDPLLGSIFLSRAMTSKLARSLTFLT